MKPAVIAPASFKCVLAFVPDRGFDIVMVAASFGGGMLKSAIITPRSP